MKSFFAVIIFLVLITAQTRADESVYENKFGNISTSGDNEEYLIRVVQKSGADFAHLPNAFFLSKDFTLRYDRLIPPPPLDFNQNIDVLSLQDLRFLKFELYARKGYLFSDAALRDHFNRLAWYQPVYWTPGYNFSWNEQEEAFFQKIKKRESELLSKNYITDKKNIKSNVDNIINKSQFKTLAEPILSKLKENGFALVESDKNEIYINYEQNAYTKVPNFITTDAYLQIFNEYFVSLMDNVETQEFIPILKNLVKKMRDESYKIAMNQSLDKNIRDAAKFNAFFYAVPCYLLMKDNSLLPAEYINIFDEQIKLIESADGIDNPKVFKEQRVDYSLFKPRGVYAGNKEMRAYFKAVTWLGVIPFAIESDEDVSRLALSASIMKSAKDSLGRPIMEGYEAMYNIIGMLIGEPDNLSCYDVFKIFDKLKIDLSAEKAISSVNMKLALDELKRTSKRKIIPAGISAHVDKGLKLNFLPQRYTPDAEIMSKLVNLTDKSDSRYFPRGLDVFSAFGNKSAENIELNFYNEAKRWHGFADSLKELQINFNNYDFNANIYSRWINSLNSLFIPNDNYPYFMKLDAWNKKNLNSSLASWAELKHASILYAEQAFGAEGGDDGDEHAFELPPPPTNVGYVEPNLSFWNASISILENIKTNLSAYHIYNSDIADWTGSLLTLANRFKYYSQKEINKINLTANEYDTISVFGGDLANFTVKLRLAKVHLCDNFDSTNEEYGEPSPDEAALQAIHDEDMRVAADVFTTNTDCLEVATGNAHDIYVPVEIGGYLYLTKGAILSYREFTQPISNRLTDKEWRQMCDSGKGKEIEKWMSPYFAPKTSIEENSYEEYPQKLYDNYNKPVEEPKENK